MIGMISPIRIVSLTIGLLMFSFSTVIAIGLAPSSAPATSSGLALPSRDSVSNSLASSSIPVASNNSASPHPPSPAPVFSYTPSPAPASPTSPDLAFQVVEDSSDIWSWNAEMIKRHRKADNTWTYYRATLVYSMVEVKWDPQSRTATYFLDGDRILAQEAQKFAKAGSGFAVGSKTPVGDPRFTLSVSYSPPAGNEGNGDSLIHPPHPASPATGAPCLKGDGKILPPIPGEEENMMSPQPREEMNIVPPQSPENVKGASSSPMPALSRLRNRYQKKYHPDQWQFTALAVTRDFVWVAIRSIPRPPESMPGFHRPGIGTDFKSAPIPSDGAMSEKHFHESSALPIQGGILRINKDTGEWVRFTEKNGLPDTLICHPLRGTSLYLPYFLASQGHQGKDLDHEGQEHGHDKGKSQSQEQGQGFSQEVVAITPLAEIGEAEKSGDAWDAKKIGEPGRVRVRFTTRVNQHVWYDEKQERWENETGNGTGAEKVKVNKKANEKANEKIDGKVEERQVE